jgi:hypothetical protein
MNLVNHCISFVNNLNLLLNFIFNSHPVGTWWPLPAHQSQKLNDKIMLSTFPVYL